MLNTGYSNKQNGDYWNWFRPQLSLFFVWWHSQLFTALWQACPSNASSCESWVPGQIYCICQYSASSALLTILPLVYLLYKNPGPFLYIIPSPWRWLMVGGQLIAAIVAPRAMLDAPHRFKIRSQLSAPKTPEAGPLNIRGIYRWVRDPFLLTGLIIIWLTPFMTVNLLVIYILTTIYLYLGSLHWERRLVAQFGDEYREYQKRVHRIIPHLGGHY